MLRLIVFSTASMIMISFRMS